MLGGSTQTLSGTKAKNRPAPAMARATVSSQPASNARVPALAPPPPPPRREEEEQGKGRQFLLLCLTEQESAGTGVKGAQITAQGVVAEPASEPEP